MERTTLVLILVMVAWHCPATVVAAPPPAEAYGRLPAYFDAMVSPDGKHFALGRNEQQGEQYLQIVEAATGTTVSGVKHREMTRDRDRAVMRRVGWADNSRATYLLSATLPIMRIVPEMALTPGRSLIDVWRTALLDIGTNRTYLVRREPKHDWGLTFTDLHSPIPGQSDVGRMVIRSNPYRQGTVNLYDVNLATGATRLRQRGNSRTRTFLLDAAGNPRVRLDVDETLNEWRIVILEGDGDRVLSTGISDTGGVGLVGLTGAGEVVLLDRRETHSADVLQAVDPQSGSVSILAAHDRYDVEAALVDPWTRSVVGARIVEELVTDRFFDPALEAVLADLRKKLPGASVSLQNWSADRQTFFARIERPGDAGGLYAYLLPAGQLMLLGLDYPELKPADLGVRQGIEYKARDGVAVPAYLTLPDDTMQARRPLVVLVHGGPTARDTLAFDWWASFLASRGYAVIQPNFRGSGGYGNAWQEAGYREWGRLMQDDIEDAVRALVRAGVADASRVCIAGASYGGYAALVGGTRDADLYRCVVSVAGVSDLPKMLQTELLQSGRHSATVDWWTMLIGDRLEDRDHLRSVSPAFQAEQAKAPFLLIHGELDTVVPIEQSERMQAALDRAGRSAKLVRLPGEDHWLSDATTRIRMLQEIETFLAEHLQTPESP